MIPIETAGTYVRVVADGRVGHIINANYGKIAVQIDGRIESFTRIWGDDLNVGTRIHLGGDCGPRNGIIDSAEPNEIRVKLDAGGYETVELLEVIEAPSGLGLNRAEVLAIHSNLNSIHRRPIGDDEVQVEIDAEIKRRRDAASSAVPQIPLPS